MNQRLRALIVLALVGAVTVGLVALAMAATPNTGKVYAVGVQPTEATFAPPPTVTAPAATSSTIMAPGSTTQDPDTFTTGTLAGPIQVRVVGEPACEEGTGYQVHYRISNAGRRQTGPVTAQLDLQPPIQVEPLPELTLARGSTRDGTVLVPGTGELVTVTWQGRTSFPIEVQPCPPSPDEEEAAGNVTTTTT